MIDKIRHWALLAPGLIPLVYADIFFFPLVAPKAFFFRIAVTVALVAITLAALKGKELFWSRLKTWWAWIPGALLLVAYTTSLFGVDFYHSFWSLFDRSEGLVALTYIVAYTYLLLLSVTKDFMRKYFMLVAGVGSVVGLYTIIQWVDTASGINIPLILNADGRIGATIGNAAFLAGYLGLSFFITLIVAQESNKHEHWWISGAVIQIVAILLTATRGTILALVAAGGIALVYIALKNTGNLRKIGAIGLGALLMVAGSFLFFRESLQNVPFEPVARIASIGLEDATTASRLFVWENMFAKALEQPLTGYGAEHIDYVYNQFYNPQDIVEQWFDRAHNQYLDYLVQFGIFGLLLFLVFISGLVRSVAQIRKEDIFAGNMLALLLVTYLLQSFFVFDTLNTWIVLFPLFVLGFIYEDKKVVGGRATKVSLVALSVFSLVGVWFTVAVPAYANLKLGETYYYHVANIERSVAAARAGLSVNTFADLEYGYQLYAMYTDRQQHRLVGNNKVAAYNLAYETLKANTEKYPYDARTFVYLGHVIEARPDGVDYNREENISILNRAIALSPERSQAYYMLANVYITKANSSPVEDRENIFAKAISVLEEYKNVAPNIAEPHLVLAELYNVLGRTDEGKEEFVRGVELYDRGDGGDARRIAGYLLAQNRVEEALPYLEDANNLRKNDYVVMLDLAKARLITGDPVGAAELVEIVQLEAPTLLEAEPLLIESLRNAL